MDWPSQGAYNDTIQSPEVCFSDKDLKLSRVLCDSMGLPRVYSGGFASVYQLTARDGQKWAVRCFLKHYDDSRERYVAINDFLQQSRLPCMVKVDYQPAGIRVSGQSYPLLKMEWVEGKGLDQYVQENIHDAGKLLDLARKWVGLIKMLKDAGIAHGDLHHGNILVSSSGELTLVDYDDIFVPALRGKKSHGLGFPSYQHPGRSAEDYNENMDRFSALVIYLSLISFARNPSLLTKSHCFQNENILFLRTDYLNPANSAVFREILSSSDKRVILLAEALKEACAVPIALVPDLLTLVGPVETNKEWPVAYRLKWERPGYIEKTVTRQEPIYQNKKATVIDYSRRKKNWVRVIPRILGFALAGSWYAWIPIVIAFNFSVLLGVGAMIAYLVLATIFATRSWDSEEIISTPREVTTRELVGYKHIPETKREYAPGQDSAVTCATFSPNGDFIVSGSGNGAIYKWKSGSGERNECYNLYHKGAVSGIATVAGHMIISCAHDGEVKVSTLERGFALTVMAAGSDAIYPHSIAGSSERLAAWGGELGKVYLWHPMAKSLVLEHKEHETAVSAVAFSPDAQYLLSASIDGRLVVWNLGKREVFKKYEFPGPVSTLSMSSDMKYLVVAGDGKMVVWDFVRRRVWHRLDSMGSKAGALAVSPNGHIVAFVRENTNIEFWDLKKKCQVGLVERSGGSTTCLAFSDNGSLLVCGSIDGAVSVYERIATTSRPPGGAVRVASAKQEPPKTEKHGSPKPPPETPAVETVSQEPPVPKGPGLPKPMQKASKKPALPSLVVDSVFGPYTTVTGAIEAARPGERILVRPGIYREGLVLEKPVEITGEGEASKVIIEATGKSTLLSTAGTGRIANLTLRQNGGGTWFALDIAGGGLEVEGCDITSYGLACLAVHNNATPIVIGNRIHDSNVGGGVLIYDRGQGLLENNDIFDNAHSGITIETEAKPVLRRNRIHDNRRSGVHIYQGGQGLLEDNDIFGNNQAGVEIKTNGNPTLIGNRIYEGKQTGILVSDSGRGVLEDNDIFGNTYSGVEIRTGGDPQLRRNKIHDGKARGVFVWNGGKGTLEENDIIGNAYSGIVIKEGGNPNIFNNRISKNKLRGIHVYDNGKGTIMDNDLRDNVGGAWEISKDALKEVKETGNKE